jgi:hypothetical protein
VIERRPLFHIRSLVPFPFGGGRWWDLSPTDGRFVFVKRPPAEAPGLRVVLNWSQELARLWSSDALE